MHNLTKKNTNSLENLLDKARWSRCIILAKGARGPGFKSRTSPLRAILVEIDAYECKKLTLFWFKT